MNAFILISFAFIYLIIIFNTFHFVIAVLPITRVKCDDPVTVPSTKGYILLSSLAFDQCATPYTPLTLQAQSGQRFNLSTLDASEHADGVCPVEIGSVKDVANGRRKDICAGKQRETNLVLSNGNRLELQINAGVEARLLFQYQGKDMLK